jgi:hypothetical protein
VAAEYRHQNLQVQQLGTMLAALALAPVPHIHVRRLRTLVAVALAHTEA